MKNTWINKTPPIPWEQQIKCCLEVFDFDRVHDVMHYLNWTWASSETGNKVPSFIELHNHARSYLEKAAEEWSLIGEPITITSGGFSARVSESGHLSIAFELAEGDSYWLEDEDE